MKPAELLILSGVMALFAGLIVLMSTRDFVFAGIALGLTFVIALVVVAMFALGTTGETHPDDDAATESRENGSHAPTSGDRDGGAGEKRRDDSPR